ncbi:PEP-CTERM sorting domain-containing protein [Candidatus Nitrotoga sp. 1052]|uniref:PEP-CTERM sorting domain-containing protein n=1 Tax=Candidatus Nitrotoga sp. 1052 TaxID=2886964 RepID=UPI001EF3F2B0|nr:PEP-CTERM sorting domain-containing protein [Candidatus Nitrotoga sp. 1052]CAH1084890.1 putative secreted protein with PEP-CTERM sorting signal [Candidatus Nitrotoga sp. 1052]
MKRLILASAIAMSIGVTAANATSVVNIDPDGIVVGDPSLAVGALGWGNGNAISVPRTNTLDDTFQTYAHVGLDAFIDPNGTPIGGLNLNNAGGYEWTMVTGFQEVVSSHSGTIPNDTATFKVIPGGNNFFKIYYDVLRNADNLTGKGFNNGTLILSGTVLPFDITTGYGASSFNTTGGCTIDPITGAIVSCGKLDSFLTNNYPNIQSVSGNGSSQLQIDVGFAHPDFFKAGLSLLSVNFDTFQNLPYSQQNPSSNFFDGTSYFCGAGPITSGTAAQTAEQCAANTLGSINGINGENIAFQVRGTSSFNVPEPASLALLGIGLSCLGFARRRKSRS